MGAVKGRWLGDNRLALVNNFTLPPCPAYRSLSSSLRLRLDLHIYACHQFRPFISTGFRSISVGRLSSRTRYALDSANLRPPRFTRVGISRKLNRLNCEQYSIDILIATVSSRRAIV